jgi:hypothetical protein
VEIDDMKMRDRDQEAFKRNNPLAFNTIQKQKQDSDAKILDDLNRKKKIRELASGKF